MKLCTDCEHCLVGMGRDDALCMRPIGFSPVDGHERQLEENCATERSSLQMNLDRIFYDIKLAGRCGISGKFFQERK